MHDHRDAPFAICHIYIVTNTQDSVWEGLEIGLYWRCTSAAKQWFVKKYYLFIIFFTFSNIGVCGGFRQVDISPFHVSVTGFNNVSFKCVAEEGPDSCPSNDELQWRFLDRPLKSGEKYEIQERKTKTKRKRVSMITIFNIEYSDEGTYSCLHSSSSCSSRTSSSMKVLSGMNNCVIISSAFSKGVRVGEIFRYKEEEGKKDKF